MQRPNATMANTARMRQPQGDMTAIPSAGTSGRPSARREDRAAGAGALLTAVAIGGPPLR